MKTLSDFRRKLTIGTQLETINANYGSMGIRPVSIIQSKAFARDSLNKITQP